MWRSSLWSISWLRHQMFYPYVTISGTQACESDDLSPFSCFLSSFSGMQWILGYVKMRRIAAVHPPKKGRRRSICRSLRTGTTFTQRCDIIGLQTLVRRMQTLNWDSNRGREKGAGGLCSSLSSVNNHETVCKFSSRSIQISFHSWHPRGSLEVFSLSGGETTADPVALDITTRYKMLFESRLAARWTFQSFILSKMLS